MTIRAMMVGVSMRKLPQLKEGRIPMKGLIKGWVKLSNQFTKVDSRPILKKLKTKRSERRNAIIPSMALIKLATGLNMFSL